MAASAGSMYELWKLRWYTKASLLSKVAGHAKHLNCCGGGCWGAAGGGAGCCSSGWGAG